MIEQIKQLRKEVHLLAPVTILTSSLFILGSDYNVEGKLPETLLQNKYVSNKFEYGFSLIFSFLACTCFMRFLSSFKLSSTRKITSLDVYYIYVANILTLMDSYCFWTIINGAKVEEPEKLGKLEVIQRLFTISFLIWTVVWSRHIRRGWNPIPNWMFCGIVSLLGYTMIYHAYSFYFLLCICATMSLISVHEFYKIHFYRSRVKMLHRLLILFHISLVACHLYSFNAGGLPMLRICQVLFLSISNCVYFMFVSVLIEVNEHKQYWLFLFFFCSCWVWYLNCLNFCNWFYCIYNILFKKIL